VAKAAKDKKVKNNLKMPIFDNGYAVGYALLCFKTGYTEGVLQFFEV